MKRKYFRHGLKIIAMMAMFALLVSCGSSGGGGGESVDTAAISLAVNPDIIPADGRSSATISASMTDKSGAAVPAETTVTFSTTLGAFPNGSTSYKVRTPDDSGSVTVSLIAGTIPGTSEIVATSSRVTQKDEIVLAGADAITLTATPGEITAVTEDDPEGSDENQSAIRAFVTDVDGKPVDGQEITFSLTPAVGSLSSATATTSGGLATVNFTASTVASKVTITAEASNGLSETVVVNVLPAADSGTISVTADPASIPADGTSTSAVTATLKDNDGEPLGNLPVTFSKVFDPVSAVTYSGTGPQTTTSFSSNGGATTFRLFWDDFMDSVWLRRSTGERVAELRDLGAIFSGDSVEEELDAGDYYLEVETEGNWSIKVEGNVGQSPTEVLGTVDTDRSGQAQITYTSTTIVKDTFTIEAKCGELSGSVSITQTAGAPAEVAASASPSTIYANGINTSTVSATVRDINNNLVEDGTSVSFSATSGTIGSTSTTVAGVATTTLTSILSADTVTSTVTASVDELTDTTTVEFKGVSLTDMAATPAAVFVNNLSTIAVRLRDSDGIAVPGETISFTTTGGTLVTQTATTDENGVASVDLIAPTQAGTGTITASYGLETADTDVAFNINPSGSVVVTAAATSIVADGTSQVRITAEVRNSSGNNVADGTIVSFRTTAGRFDSTSPWSPTVINTITTNGKATAMLMSSTNVGTATITATSLGVSGSASVSFISASVSVIDLTAFPNNLTADGASISTIRALVKDGYGNVVNGETVTFSVTTTGTKPGTLSARTATTSDGVATVVYTASKHAGNVDMVKAETTNGTSAMVTITLIEPSVGSVQCSVGCDSIVVGGNEKVLISATVLDRNGNIVPDGTLVTFNTTAGDINGAIPNPQYTVNASTTNGVAEAMLTSSNQAGAATIKVIAGGVCCTTGVDFVAGPVSQIVLSAYPDTLTADGSSSSAIQAVVTDAYGNPVDGEVLFFMAPGLGMLDSLKAETSNGVATATYTAGHVPGSDTLTARSAGSTSNAVVITLLPAGEGLPVGSVILAAITTTGAVADGSESYEIVAQVLDTSSQPMKNQTVIFSATGNTGLVAINPPIATTADDGTTTCSVTDISAVDDTVVITATSGGVTSVGTIGLAFIGTGGGGVPVGSVILAATETTGKQANGADAYTVTVQVLDTSNQPMNNQAVTFSASGNTGLVAINPPVTTTAQDGTATCQVTDISSISDTVYISASSGGVNSAASIRLDFAPPSGQRVPAYISLATSQVSVKSDNSDSATITATVLDADNVVIEGVPILFGATGGQLTAALVETDANGQAEVTFSSGPVDQSNQVVTISATVAGLPTAQIPVQITGSTVTVSTDNTTITEDGSTTAKLTVTAKNAGGIPVYNTPITLTVTGAGDATLSAYSGNTDTSGKLEVTVTGTSAGTVTVTVQGLGATATQDYTVVGTAAVFFRITLPEGESVSWETTASGAVAITESNQIAFNDNDPNEDTITRSDGGSFATDGFAAGDRIMVGGSTSNDGIYEIATVAAGTLTLIETDALITEAAGASLTVTNGVLVRVEAPDPTTSVRFASTFGVWDNTGSSVIEKAVVGDFVSAVFTSPVAGLATIHVSDEDDPTLYDQLDVVVSAPSADSAYIMLQSNTYVVPPSTGGISQEAILTASVRTSVASGRQPVGGAAVAFSVKNQTGGGEKVFPVVVFTDDSGVATTTFSSGSLSSGADGVTVSARVLGKGQTGPLNTIAFHAGSPATITRSDLDSFIVDGFEVGEQILVEGSARNDGNYILSAITANTLTLAEGEVLADEAAGGSVTMTALATSVNIVIGGTAGSIVIGSGSKIEVLSPTTYSLPMSVLVSDSNGNPVSGAKVSLGAWPSFYSTGGWQHLEETTIDPTTGIMVTTQLEECEAIITGTYANEDLNENLFLDPGEDSGPDPGHGDGQLTPPNSAAGNVPMSVTTDDNGVANFSLVYMKSSAVWIVDRIRASTLVLGTETTSSTTFRLPAEESEAEACDLPNSPYNRPAEVLDVDSIALTATPNNMTADGSSKSAIIALVTDKNGNAVDGELITFAVTTGTGTLSPDTATASGGLAQVTYTASATPGTETVTATAENGVFATVDINLIEAIVGSVSVSAGSDSVVADGTSRVSIMAEVRDTNGTAVADGTTVTFTTTAGTFSDITTTLNGVARAMLTSSTHVGTANIEATAGGVIGRTTVTFIPGPVDEILLTATPMNLTADGASTSTIRALVTDNNGNVVNGETVAFSIVSGSGKLSAATATTNGGGGVASVTYTASTTPGTVTVRAHTTNGETETVDITLIEPIVKRIDCQIGCDDIVAGDMACSAIPAGGEIPLLVHALVYDLYGNVVPDGTPVTITTTAGTFDGAPSPGTCIVVDTLNGEVTAMLIPSTQVGTANIAVWAGGVCCKETVEFVSGPVAAIALTATQEVLTANGSDQSTIRAVVTDAEGNPVDGATIIFTLQSSGTLSASTATTSDGVAAVTYTAGTKPGTDTIIAESTNGQSATMIITLVPGLERGTISVTASPTSIVADGVSTSLITASLRDDDGAAIVSVPVEFYKTRPELPGLPQNNTWKGEGDAETNTPFHSDGGSTTFTFFHETSPSNPFSPFSVELCDYDAVSDGNSYTSDCRFLITATGSVDNEERTIVLDPGDYYLKVSEAENQWSIEVEGNISQVPTPEIALATVDTNVSGDAEYTYTSGTQAESVTITAISGKLEDQVSILQTAGAASQIEIEATPDSINANGINRSALEAIVTDANDNPVDGITVTFSATAGTLDALTAVTSSSGVARTTLTATTGPSVTSTVTATAGVLTDNTTVEFVGITLSLAATETSGKVANGADSYEVIAQVLNGTGQPVSGESVTFSGTGHAGLLTISPATSTTDSDGRTTCQVTDISSGTDTVTISASTGNVASTNSIGLAFTGTGGGGGVPVGSVILAATETTGKQANGVDSYTVTVQVKDTSNQPMNNQAVTFSASGNLGLVAIDPPVTTTQADGTATCAVTDISDNSDTVDISASSGGVSSAAPVTLNFSVPSGPGAPASLGLATSQISVKSDNSDSATITATVLDGDKAVMEGITVEFTADGGQLNASAAQTDANGQAQVIFSSGSTDQSNRVVTITATVAGLVKTIPVQITGSTLTASTDNVIITSDGSTTATLTITARNAGGTPVYDTPITLTVTGAGGATLSAYSGNTDINGKLEVTVTGTSSGSVTVTADGLGTTTTQNYTVSAAGAVFGIVQPQTDPFAWFTLDPGPVAITGPSTQIAFADANPDTITRSDGGDFTTDGFNSGDRIMVGGSSSNDTDAGSGTPLYYTIDTVTAGTLTLVATDELTTEAAGASVTITSGVLVTVQAPTQINVQFVSTLGVWDSGITTVITKAVAAGQAQAILSSAQGGVSTVQVIDPDDPSTTDTLTVAFSAPSTQAAHISLQANTNVLPISVGGNAYTATLTASVRTSSATGRQPVGGAPVAFSITDQTGGGETVNPAIVFTDSSGVATTTFTSGSLASGAEGVSINATVLGQGSTGPLTTISFSDTNPDTIVRSDAGSFVTDGYEAGEQIRVQGSASNDGYYILASVTATTLELEAGDALTAEAEGQSVTITAVTTSFNMVIGGTAGSLVIGRGSQISTLDATTYSLPMSVLVADSNGNPVSGAPVSLSAWPTYYSTGGWALRVEETLDPTTGIITKTLLDICDPSITDTYPNEDINENLFLDPGEDVGPNPGHGDGQLTPPNSAAGTVPVTVTTDQNGVATFDLVYMKSSALWIVDRIRASTLVLGTETTSSMSFRLPYLLSEGEACTLPDSPYNIPQEVAYISLTASPDSLSADGSSTSVLSAEVFDQDGSPVAGEVLSFSMAAGTGTVWPPTGTTDATGLAQVVYTASTTSGTETVMVTAANGVSDSVDIDLAGSTVPDKVSLSASQISVKSDNSDNATITATVLDADNVVVEGVAVTFSSDGGQLSASGVDTDASGQAQVIFSSGSIDPTNQIVTITARVAGLAPAQIPIQVVGSTLALTTDNNVITSDGSTTATLTILAKDASGTPVYDAPITLTSTGSGTVTISPSSGDTDVLGQLEVTVTGTSAGDVTVTAEGLGTTATQDYEVILAGAVFFRIVQPQSDPITWNTLDSGPVAITGPSTQIAFADVDPDTITRSDGGDFTTDGFSSGDRIMVGGSTDNDTDTGSGTPLYYTIDTVTASTLTLIATDQLVAEAAGASVVIANSVLVRVEAPAPTTTVKFATTFGSWDGGESPVVSKNVVSGYTWAVFSSSLAGVATIHVTADDDPTSFDSLQAVISAPSADAAHITLQSNTNVVPLSVGSVSNTATLTASVRTSSATGRQPVGGAPVAFSIQNQTGGGETIFPVIVYTDASGIATTTFTSGSLSSGAEGVTISATVLGQGSTGPLTTISFNDTNPDTIVRSDGGSFITDGYQSGEQIRVRGSQDNDGWYIIDSVTASTLTLDAGDTLTAEAEGSAVTITAVTASTNIVVGGTAGSLVIGRGSEITVLSPTTYSLPMSVLVADANGNPVPGTTVSLNAWPIQYSTGEWVEVIIITDQYCEAKITGTYPNEDLNENLFLDPGEDTGNNPGHGDGELTPPNSAAGTVPMTVTTDQNGVANFDLVYMKSSAMWIVDRIQASTLVLGTETTSSMTFRLPAEKDEAWRCELPDSPYNKELPVDSISLSATPNNLTADGVSTSTIRAQVFDSNGLAVEGEVVNFDVPTGTGTLSVPTGTTDDQGVAEIIYTASTAPGTETVRATTANGTWAEVDITLIEAVVGSVSCQAGCDSIIVGGTTPIQISGTVLDSNGKTIQDGTAVTFTTSAGEFQGANPATPTTIDVNTAGGVAIAGLLSPDSVGTATIKVTSGGVCCEVTVDFIAGPVDQISTLTATPNNLTADGASTSLIRAFVVDANGNAVENGETITFGVTTTGTTPGTLSSLTATTTNGMATVTYTASTEAGETDTIQAEAWDPTIFSTVNITLIDVVVDEITVTTGSDSAVADGASQTLIAARVTDGSSNTVPDGTTVTFTTTLGEFSGAPPATPTVIDADTTNGVAIAWLVSPTSVGKAAVIATAGGVSGFGSVTFIPGAPYAISLTASPDELSANGTDTSTIHAFVTDEEGNAVADGETIFFEVTTGTGTVAPLWDDTEDGVAEVTYTASTAAGVEWITAESSNGTTQTTTVTLLAVSEAATMSVAAAPSTIVADGVSTSVVTATLEDIGGSPIVGVPVTFSKELNPLPQDNTYAGSGSKVTLPFRSNGGIVTFTMNHDGASNFIVWLWSQQSGRTALLANEIGAVSDYETVEDLNTEDYFFEVTADGTWDIKVEGNTAEESEKEPLGTGITNGSGQAQYTYTSTTTKGVFSIQGAFGDVTGDVTITQTADTEAQIDLNADPSSIYANGGDSSTISATVRDANDNLVEDGTTVTFSATAGTIPASATTTDGVATADLVSTLSLVPVTSTVTATVGAVPPETIDVDFVPASLTDMAAIPGSVPLGETSTISVRLKDDNNVGVAGETITFTTTDGTLATSTAQTGASGVASVVLTAPDATGTATVTASYGLITANLSVDFYEYAAGSITVTAGSDQIPADGSTYTLISATVLDSIGNNMPDGTAVAFSTTAGTLSDITTTVSGVATARLTSSTNVGTATVRATSSGVSDTVQVAFISGAPFLISLTATPNNIIADATTTSTIRAFVTDVDGNAVEGEVISFYVDPPGTGTLSAPTATTSGGVATVTYTSSTTPGTEIITAEATNGVSAQVGVTLIGAQIGSIVLTANPTNLPADGASEATISATVTLVGGGDAPDGTAVSFSIVSEPAPFDSSITPIASTAAGVATAFLTSGTGVGTAVIRAEAGGRRAELEFDFTPGSLTLSIVPNVLLGTGEAEATVTATLRDVTGLPPAAGETVNFTLDDLSLGTITPSALSDADGEAEGLFLDAGIGGTVTVTGTWTTLSVDVTGSATIDIQPPPAFIENAEGSPDPASINIKGTGGKSTSLITFDVKDSSGNLVADGYRIDFSLDSGPNGGENIVPLSATTAGGQVSTILYSGFKSGPVSIRATYHNDRSISTTTSQIAISGGPPVGEEFGIFAEYWNISGFWMANLQDNITINAADIYGNAIPDDTAISFKTYNTGGFFTPNSATTLDGMATNVLHSAGTYLSPLQGFVSVTGEAINGGRTTHVTSLIVDPLDSNILYAGTDGGGVYKSSDAGATWVNISRSSENAKQGQNWIDPHVKGNSAICVDADDANRVYVGTGYLGRGNVYRSLDGGMNWNSNNVEEWYGIFGAAEAVLTVLCDGDATTPTDYPYVWIGTEGLGALFAADGETFQWGGIVQPLAPTTEPVSGVYSNPADVGDGTMTEPTLSASSKTEDWTTTYRQSGATASTPVLTLAVGSNADGTMTNVSATETAGTGTWTMTYTGGYDAGTGVTGTGTAQGTLTVVSTSANTLGETWTITCTDGTDGSEVFRVEGDTSGLHADTSLNTSYSTTNQEVTFYITETGDFLGGEVFNFDTDRDAWDVEFDDGINPPVSHNDARTDVVYTSDNSEVSFTINSGANWFYERDDEWTFNTTITGDWVVEGTVSGTQLNRARNNLVYTSDNYEVTFTITDGATAFAPGDEFTFSVIESGLGYGKVVRDIVRIENTHGGTAELYAGTNTGVYRSANGGLTWHDFIDTNGNDTRDPGELSLRFSGDFVTTLAVHPTVHLIPPGNRRVLYVGTEDAGVWVGTLIGPATWSWNASPYTAGMGEGLSATSPVADPNNVGNGVMTDVSVGADTQSEYWSFTCTTAAADGGTFSVSGSVSGSQAPYDITLGSYSILNVLDVTIADGSTDFAVGDSFTFSTTRDPGRTIKDLQVVTDNNPIDNDHLYAITYFWGPLEPHAVGNVYAYPLADIALESAVAVVGDMEIGGTWSEANTSLLPAYDPPDDMTPFAQHVMALDVEVNPTALYVGGEGINLYKATQDFLPALPSVPPNPNWQVSKSGLTNLIMARMPILFSDRCTLSVLTEREGNVVTFFVYVQDQNGNPPVQGSMLVGEYEPEMGENVEIINVVYPDCYVHQGTFRDPGDPSTNDPYVHSISVNTGDVVTYTFTPWCTEEAPGCSGSVQIARFTY